MTLEETLKQYFDDRHYNEYMLEIDDYEISVEYKRSIYKTHEETFWLDGLEKTYQEITKELGSEDWIFSTEWEEVFKK
jgi:hypothetical protein